MREGTRLWACLVAAPLVAGCSFLFSSSAANEPTGGGGTVTPTAAAPPVVATHSVFSTGFRSYTTWNLSETLEAPSVPAVCKLPGGGVLAVWQEGQVPVMRGTILRKDDALPPEPVTILEFGTPVGELECVGTTKGAIILWRDQGGDLVYHRMSADGVIVGDPAKVSDFKSMPGDFDAVAVGSDVFVAFVDGDLIAVAHIDAKGKVKVSKSIQSGAGAKLVQVVEEKKGGLVYVFWAEDLPGVQNESFHYAGLDLKGKLRKGPFSISPAQGRIVELDVMADPMIDDKEHRFMASVEFVQPGGGRTSWKYYFYSGALSEPAADNGATTNLMQYMDAEGDVSGECYTVASSQISGAATGIKCWLDNWPGEFHLDLHLVTGLSDVDPAGFSGVISDGTFYLAYVAQEAGRKDVFLVKAYDADLIDPPPPPPPPTYSEPAYSEPYYSGSSYSGSGSSGSGDTGYTPPPPSGAGGSSEGVQSDCTFNGIKLNGKVKVVDAFPDIEVKVVSAFPDIKVKQVDAFPDSCGEWQFVDAFPDFTIKYVDAFPDINVQFVDAFPGL